MHKSNILLREEGRLGKEKKDSLTRLLSVEHSLETLSQICKRCEVDEISGVSVAAFVQP